MPERSGIFDKVSTLGIERTARRIKRFFRPTFAFDQREEAVRGEFLAAVLRIWVITIFIVTLPMLIITISEAFHAIYVPEYQARSIRTRSWARTPAAPGLPHALARPPIPAE